MRYQVFFVYIKGTQFINLTFYRDFDLHLLVYFDVDKVVNVSTWRFIISNYIFIGRNLIS